MLAAILIAILKFNVCALLGRSRDPRKYILRLYTSDQFSGSRELFNPHQRCGYGDSPFARIQYFYTAGSRNRLQEVAGGGPTYKIIQKESQITKKGFATSQTRQKRRKVTALGKYASQKCIQPGKMNFKAWRRLWEGSRSSKTPKKT